MHVSLQVAAPALQPNGPKENQSELLPLPPVTAPRHSKNLPEPSVSSQDHTPPEALLTPQAPPLSSLPESSDSLPRDFMQQPDLPESPLHHFLQRDQTSKPQSPLLLCKASRLLGSQLEGSVPEGRAVREDSAQQVLAPVGHKETERSPQAGTFQVFFPA